MQHWTQDTGQDEDKRRKTQQWKPKTWTTLFSEKMVEKKKERKKKIHVSLYFTLHDCPYSYHPFL